VAVRKNEVVIPILNDEYSVVVCWGTFDERVKALIRWGYATNDKDLIRHTKGQAFFNSKCFPLILLPHKPVSGDDAATLAHEAVHAVTDIFNFIDQSLDGEVFAHSVAAVVRMTLRKTRRKRA
jgi:hypothetical protein